MAQRTTFWIGLAAGVLAAVHVHAAAIEHTAVGCVVADAFPRFEARVVPADSVARARVFFRGSGAGWYAVAMTRTGDTFAAILPKPKKSLPRLIYYLEVVDTAMATSRTAEHTASVAPRAASCAPDMMAAPSVATASVLVEAPSGAAAIPAGFSGTSVTAAAPVAAAGAAAGAAGVTAATGGGVGATTIIVAGAGVAAVGAGAVVAANVVGSDGEGDGEGGNGSGFVQVRGVVYGRLVPNPANPTGPGLYEPPIAGAVVSTSLDSTTAVTDGTGRFHLMTQTRLRGCEPFTLTITAGGWPTWVGTGTFHNGESPNELVFAMIPRLPNTPFTGCTPS
jgi:hypothetical protein